MRNLCDRIDPTVKGIDIAGKEIRVRWKEPGPLFYHEAATLLRKAANFLDRYGEIGFASPSGTASTHEPGHINFVPDLLPPSVSVIDFISKITAFAATGLDKPLYIRVHDTIGWYDAKITRLTYDRAGDYYAIEHADRDTPTRPSMIGHRRDPE